MIGTSELTKVQTMGFDLEEVKVTFLHDIKITVAGLDVEGKQGEIKNVPRWAANVLESEKHVSIQDTDMVVELKQAIVKENVQGNETLSALDLHFYIKLNAFIKKLPQQDYEKVHPMLRDLVRKRRAKIIQQADSSNLTADLSNKLTTEERIFYEKIYKGSLEFEEQVLGNEK